MYTDTVRSFKDNSTIVYVLVFVTGFVCVLSLWTLLSPQNTTSVLYPPKNPPYLDPSVSTEVRITNLLSYMTLEEKVAQMALVDKNSIPTISDVSTYGLGAVLSGFGAKPDTNTIDGWTSMVSNFVDASKHSRLGIPILYGADAIHGHSNVPGATIFPHAIGLGATRNTELVENVARATAEELRATEVNWSFSPNLDMPRDIRWGRVYETFSDDPSLVSSLGTAYVQGSQKQPATSSMSILFVLATPKHYVGAGGMMWNSSSNKNFRIDQGTTENDDDAFRSEYLLPFQASIDAGAKSIMVGLNSWGDKKLAESEYLLTGVLKEELEFDGFLVSDWYGVYEMPGNDYDNAVTAINAGIDMVMLPFDYKTFITNVVHAVRKGTISEVRIDDAVRRILRAKFALGLFDVDTASSSRATIGSLEHRALARRAVGESLVLLKNSSDVLPIRDDVRHIRVAGTAGDNVGQQSGAWTVEWQGISGNSLLQSTSILAGIRERVGKDVDVEYAVDGVFTDTATRADLGIAIVGEKPYAEGWGDTEYPILDTADREAIQRLQESCETIIVVIVSGRPLFITQEIRSWDAVVMAWLPGSEGGGVADVLFGDRPFVGRLPLPWPHHAEQLPITATGLTADDTAVLFPRGFGL